MKTTSPGSATTIFLLFFGVALLDAANGGSVYGIFFWLAVAAVFVAADLRPFGGFARAADAARTVSRPWERGDGSVAVRAIVDVDAPRTAAHLTVLDVVLLLARCPDRGPPRSPRHNTGRRPPLPHRPFRRPVGNHGRGRSPQALDQTQTAYRKRRPSHRDSVHRSTGPPVVTTRKRSPPPHRSPSRSPCRTRRTPCWRSSAPRRARRSAAARASP